MTESIIFMGTPEFAVPVLKGLLADADYEVKAVVTQPDRPVGRKQIMHASPVKEAALAADLPIYQPEKLSGSTEMAELIALQPDFIVTAAYGQFLPTKLLTAAQKGAVNVHGSLLPKYRGGAPVQYAIMNGDAETGVTIMYMIKQMDAGNILAQTAVSITDDDNVATVMEKLSLVGRDLLLATLPRLIEQPVVGDVQDEEQVTFSPNISAEQRYLNFENETATELDYHVRGLYPTHPAFAMVHGERYKVARLLPMDQTTTEKPGQVVEKSKHQLLIAAENGTVVAVEQWQPAGKAMMSVNDYLNGVGQHVAVGDQLIDTDN